MAGFNIASFSSEIGKTGYLQTNKYLVGFNSPPILQNFVIDGKPVNEIEKMIQIRADSVKIPGIALLMADANRYGIGPVQKMPYNASFTTNSISFIADRKAAIYKYFYTWINGIFEFAGATGSIVNGKSTLSRGASYQTEYKDNYTTDLHIYVFDNTGRQIKEIVMLKAFPESLNEVPMSWNQNNELMKVTVSFTFRDWHMINVQSEGPSNQQGSTSPSFAKLADAVTNDSTISTSKNSSVPLLPDFGKFNQNSPL